MNYCKLCVQPDTRPGMSLDKEGVCPACRFSQSISTIDWDNRWEQVSEIAEWAKSHDAPYDCAIGVSGGKDSTLQALTAKNRLGLNCLLVNCAPPQMPELGRYNRDNLQSHGFDMITWRTNPVVLRSLIKRSFYDYGNLSKPCEYSLWASTFRVALQWGIPLVIQGENAGLTLGCTDGLGTNEDAMNVNLGNSIAGGNALDWVTNTISEKHLTMYQFPDKQKMRDSGMRAIFIQHYLKDWSPSKNAAFAIANGLRIRENITPKEFGGTHLYECLDSDWYQANQVLKYYKLGFGFATDEACYDIREGLITREEGIELVRKYDGRCGDKFIIAICDYLRITQEEFWRVVESFVNKDLFYKDDVAVIWHPIPWSPKFKVE